ncbi:MAG: hypothetical protein JWN99_547 [Ilumatobacteraceae bacterium]|nr:hypothetical protein [Ilumatobacteraceae bacterium]
MSDVFDSFDALLAGTTPVQPDRRFADALRDQLIAELGAPMTDTATIATTPAPAGAGTVTPYLCVDGAAAAIDFYVAAFGAVEDHRLVGDDGRIGHAEIVIGDSRLMLADEYPEYGVLSPTTRGGSSTNFTISVPDADQAFARALQFGATELRPVADQFYGYRQGAVVDPFGHQWSLRTPIADYDVAQYAQLAAAEGFHVQQTDAPTPATIAHDPGHQLKSYGPGDLYYFTLPVTDLGRAHTFFGAVLGWQFDGAENGHATNISAPPGGVNQSGEPGARLWFVVDDIHEAVARVSRSGGTSQEPVLYDSGWAADCVDDQGTVFSLSVPADKYRA